MSTLIVRDATLAVNGAPETRGQAAQHLDRRVLEVVDMDEETAADCLEVLQPSAGNGEECDLEVLLALTVLGLAKPEQAESRGLSVVAMGRRLGARLEQAGDANSALEVIERLREAFPTHEALERDHDAVLGRLGMVQDLADRYFQRAQRLAEEGEKEEAVGWLREVLLLDGARSDAARMIRDLRLAETRKRTGRRRMSGTQKGLVLTALVLTLIGIHEVRVRAAFQAIPAADLNDLASASGRLESLEAFQSRHPVWHGTFAALAERSSLRIQVGKLEREEQLRAEQRQRLLEERFEEADLIHRRAEMHVDTREFEAAVADYREALRLAPEGWAAREQVERDVEAVIEHMKEVNR